MQHPVPLPQSRLPARTCVWMDAGLLAYKLCDRGFDCANCPLDAALRGDARAVLRDETPGAERPASPALPEDRRYTTGHVWLSPRDSARSPRLGLDAFAAALLTVPRAFRHVPPGRPVRSGKPVCAVILPGGSLTISAPVSGRLVRWNEALDDHPALLQSDPYGAGWLAEWTPEDAAAVGELLHPEPARRQAALDARRYRRRVATRLLADAAEAGDDWRVDTDVRDLLGARAYLDLLGEFIH